MAYATELCGSKLRAKLSSTLNEATAEKISSTSFAAKQMAKMGWKEGTGLGKKRDGIVSHIKVQKREENMGLGVEKERTRQLGVEGMWWNSSVADTLMKLQQKNKGRSDEKSKKKKKDKKEKKSKKSKKDGSLQTTAGKVYTDEELFAATGGARFGTKGGKRAEGKWKRSESSKELKEWEEEVKDKVEWNGLGKANVILSENQSEKKRSKKRRWNDEENNEGFEEKKDDDDGQLMPEASELSDEKNDGQPEKRKKAKKIEKKSKKKKKTKQKQN